jgi:N-methylhydantoinase B
MTSHEQLTDPILIEVLRNEVATVTEEMSIAVERTARSSLMQLGDFATALADTEGRVVSVHPSSPLFTTMFSSVSRGVIDKWKHDLAPRDVIVCNDPYLGGSHKPDVFVIMPIFSEDELVGFTLAYSHQSDVGGRFAGGFSSHAISSYDEGLHLPCIKLDRAGERNDALVDLLRSNVRHGGDFLSDIDAKIAGCWRGAEEFRRIVDKHGVDAVSACFDHDFDFAERTTRSAIRGLPDGRFEATMYLTDDGVGNTVSLPVSVAVTIDDEALTVDLTGTTPQLATGVNMPLANTYGQVFDALHALLGDGTTFSEGFTRPITILAPPGTVVNPIFPGAVGGRASVFYLVAEAVYHAMAEAVPDRVPVPPDGADVIHAIGTRSNGTEFGTMDIIWAGWGARPTRDGVDGAATIAYVGMPAELLERDAPIIVEEFGFVSDSGGPGKFRGGLSVVKRFRFLEDTSVMVRTIRANEGSAGMAGGSTGAPSANFLIAADGTRTRLAGQTHLHLEVSAGESIHHEVGGSGGHGDPHERDVALVVADCRAGKETRQHAFDIYGVVIGPAYGHETMDGSDARRV